MCSRSINLYLALLLAAGWLSAQQFEGVSRPKKVNIGPPVATEELTAPAEETVVYPTSDIDVDIPKTDVERPAAVGVIIGIREYAHADVPQVDYAQRDAELMRAYLLNTLGYREENIIMVLNQAATQAAFNRIFGGQLQNYIRPGESEVFVYYSGHGAPDLENNTAYFVPYDADPNYARQTGYSLEQFYRQLSELEAKSVTVVVDACFSGSSEGGMLIQQASPVFISVENPAANLENGVVFTSSSGDQISSWYRDMGHGLFTYFFLKGLRGAADRDQDEQITSTEIYGYLMENVPYLARRMFNREQTPQLMGGALDQILVQF